MVGALFPWVAVGLMFAASALAFAQVPADARLPMQWGIRGDVKWRAPRAVALLFAPVLAALILGFITGVAGARAGELSGLTFGIALVFVVSHALYVYCAVRDVQGSRGGSAPGPERQA
ncbi:MAG: hypothetical protein ACREH4_05690 [Vitreimonas sp.]